MIAIAFRFPGGHYHATPWGRHVNEGLIEWPPSPWRILRALIACYHRKCSYLSEELVRSLINKLIRLPSYRLPQVAAGHTRHYMPQKDPLGSDKTKIFDTFALTSGSLVVAWPDVDLTPDEQRALAVLMEGISYLGRAESWVEGCFLQRWSGDINCFPHKGAVPAGWEIVSLLAPQQEESFQEWIRDRVQDPGNLAQRSRLRGRKPTLPSDLWMALHAETANLQSDGWSSPPGGRWVDYVRPANPFQAGYSPDRRSAGNVPYTVARFALAGSVLPRLTEALAIGERMRQALISQTQFVDVSEAVLSIFSGKSADGSQLRDNHMHAFYLPADDNNDGWLDHIMVYIPGGISEEAQKVLTRLRRLWGAGGHDIFTVLVGMGHPEEYGGMHVSKGRTPQLGSSRVWVSRTPFMLLRHPKMSRSGQPKMRENGLHIDGPEEQLRRELMARGFPDPVRVDLVSHVRVKGKNLYWQNFRRQRTSGGGQPAGSAGYGFRLTFAEPVRGPLCLGYGCHFGLGQFVPDGVVT